MYALTFLSLIALSSAFTPDRRENPWIPPGPSDSRSPCPGINTLANHGYLPRHGQNLTAEQFGDAVAAGFGWSRDFGEETARVTFDGFGVDMMSLEDLNAANASEHRASMTRDDDDTGNALTLAPWRLDALLNDSDNDWLSIESLAKTRLRVEALTGYPPLTEFQQQTARSESSLLLMLMTDVEVPPAQGNNCTDLSILKAPKERVQAWLSEERLPFEHGWQRPKRAPQPGDLGPVAAAILGHMRSAHGK